MYLGTSLRVSRRMRVNVGTGSGLIGLTVGAIVAMCVFSMWMIIVMCQVMWWFCQLAFVATVWMYKWLAIGAWRSSRLAGKGAIRGARAANEYRERQQHP
jgi:ABC-type transport system involved in Fe-S cluster assembly fused permease/ATPase subunit